MKKLIVTLTCIFLVSVNSNADVGIKLGLFEAGVLENSDLSILLERGKFISELEIDFVYLKDRENEPTYDTEVDTRISFNPNLYLGTRIFDNLLKVDLLLGAGIKYSYFEENNPTEVSETKDTRYIFKAKIPISYEINKKLRFGFDIQIFDCDFEKGYFKNRKDSTGTAGLMFTPSITLTKIF